jgi:hypothetical protein
MTVNPEFCRDPSYYRTYGMSYTQVEEGEGAPIRLDISAPGMEIHVGLFNWSRAVYEGCAAKAGFRELSWTNVTVSDEGLSRFGRDYWDRYLAVPPILVATAAA